MSLNRRDFLQHTLAFGALASAGCATVEDLGTFTNPVIHSLLDESLDTASLGPDGWYNETKNGGADSRHIDFQPISDLAESVVEDVRKIRENPLVPKYIPIYGYIYDVKTGALVEVPAATEVGKAR